MNFPKRAEHLAWRKLGDHTLVIDSRINQEVHHFNEIGSFIWELCDGTQSFDELVGKIQSEYDVDKETATQDIQNFIDQLGEKKLLLNE